MSNRSASISECDAPPYSIVKACQMIGVQTPEDVRWCRLSRLRETLGSPRALLTLSSWKSFLGMEEVAGAKCSCGTQLPQVERYTFTYISGRESHYYIGQCRKCRTVFWEGSENR
jgi:hypothetical protein